MCKFDILKIRKSSALALMLMASAAGWSQTQISDEAGLKAIANDLTGEYVLTQDITLSGEWAPIGTQAAPFEGTLDGNGHSIKGLTVTSGIDNQGFFSFTKGATIQNVRFVNALVKGDKQVGIVAGQAINTTIDQVFTSGVVTGYDHIGGIVGDARGNATDDEYTVISNCLSTAGAYSTSYQAGVIAGWTNAGTFVNNVALGSAAAPNGGAAGICGMLDNSGVANFASNVSAAAAVTGQTNRTHGISGWKNGGGCMYGDMSSNYSSANTVYTVNGEVVDAAEIGEGDADFEGIQGEVVDDATLKTAATYTDIDFADAWTLTDGSYPVLKGMTTPIEGDAIDIQTLPAKCAIGLTFDLKARSTMGRNVTITPSDPSVVSVDGTVLSFDAIGTSTITLSTTGDAYSAGATKTVDVTVSSLNYAIKTAEDLANIKYDLEGNFTLENDIDLAGINWAPIGEFTGTFDGKGHYIKNLTFNNPDQNNVGLFSTTRGATIKNLGIEGAKVIGRANSAAIVGQAYGGEISSCAVINSYIEGFDHAASISGNMTLNEGQGGVISDCISDSRIATRSYQVAGISGVFNGGEIKNCLFSGTVTGPSTTAGGIISLNESNGAEGTTDPSANLHNNVVAASHIYGNIFRIGNPDNRPITFADNYVLENTFCGGSASTAGPMNNETDPSSMQGANATVDDLRSKAFYEGLGWDFDNTWKFLDGGEGNMYPVLAWMNAPLPTTILDMPQNKAILYKEGYEFLDLNCIHGSWGQKLAAEIVEGAGKAFYDESLNQIYAGGEDSNFGGKGDVKVKMNIDPAVASLFNIVGEDNFSIYIGMDGDKTEIKTAQEFIDINKNLEGDYILTADIDLNGVEFPGIACSGEAFTGTLDGNGHVVRNANVKFGSGSDLGVFGRLSGATLKNIAFVGFNVSASSCKHVGLIGAAITSTFDQVAAIGQVTGDDHVAIFAGDLSGGSITNCYINGTVVGGSQVGGFAGCTLENGAEITYSYFNGDLTGNNRGWTGGFVGLIDKSNSEVTITNCASVGNCATKQGSPHVAAPFIAGNNAGDGANATVTFNSNIFNNEAVMNGDTEWPNKNLTTEGNEGLYEAAQSVPASSLQSDAIYKQIGWDFDNVWTFDTTDGYLYPVLKQFGSLVTGIKDVTAGEGNASYAVRAEGNVLTVAGLTGNAVITVATVAGQNVATVKTAAAAATVSLPGKGLYIVKVAGAGAAQSYKVVNK